MHLLEAADEWPFLREVIGKGGDGDGEEEAAGEGQQEHLLCDALVGEPFYYRVGAHERVSWSICSGPPLLQLSLQSLATVDAERCPSTE